MTLTSDLQGTYEQLQLQSAIHPSPEAAIRTVTGFDGSTIQDQPAFDRYEQVRHAIASRIDEKHGTNYCYISLGHYEDIHGRVALLERIADAIQSAK